MTSISLLPYPLICCDSCSVQCGRLACERFCARALHQARPQQQLHVAIDSDRSAQTRPLVTSVVYPLLNRGRAAMSDLAIADAMRRYLASFNDPIIMHDTGVDLMLLGEALSHPEATAPSPKLRANLIGVPGYNQGIERIFSGDSALRQQRHHALIDARVARDAFLACVR